MSVRRAADRGQATVELALAMPVLCMLLLGAVQLAALVRDQLDVVDAARIAARAAAVSADPSGAASEAAQRAISQAATIVTNTDDIYVTVSVTLVNTTDVPLIGLFLPDIEVRARSSMVLEPP